MMLSTQLFDRIVGISTAKESDRKSTVLPAGCRKAPERREAARIAFGQRTLICRDSGPKAGLWDTVMLQDISMRGIGFLCHEPMPAGQTFMVKLTDKDGETIRIRCSTKRSERGGFGGTAFLVGAEYEQVIQHQAIRLTNEDGEESIEHDGVAQPTAAQVAAAKVEAEPAKPRGSALGWAASCLMKAVDPSSWLRKADDFSSVG